MSTKQASILREFIRVLNAGVDFYRSAQAEWVSSPYQSFLDDMVVVRTDALARLKPLLVTQTKEIEKAKAAAGQRGHIKDGYAELMTQIKSSESKDYIVQLEELEGRVLKDWRSLMDGPLSADARIVLIDIYSMLAESHNRLRAMKRALT